MTASTHTFRSRDSVPAAFDILMPTKDRPAFVERALRWYELVGTTQVIRIVDGSDRAGAEANAAACLKFRDTLRVEHLVCGPQTSIWERIMFGLEHTDTPYVAMTADDDFLVPDGMRRAVDDLHAMPSASAAVGLVLRRDVVSVASRRRVTYDWYEQLGRPEREVEQRLSAFADRPATLFYSLRRTEVALRTTQRVLALRPDEDFDLYFGELLDAGLQVIAGEVLFTEDLVGVREIGHSVQTSQRVGREPLARMRDARWHQRVELVEKVFAAAIRDTDRPPPDPDAVAHAFVDRLLARALLAKLTHQFSVPSSRGRIQRRYLPMLWPPTLLRFVLWKARGLPRTSREVRGQIRRRDIRVLRMIHTLAGP